MLGGNLSGRDTRFFDVLDGVTPYLTDGVELWRDGEPVTLPALDEAPAPAHAPRTSA